MLHSVSHCSCPFGSLILTLAPLDNSSAHSLSPQGPKSPIPIPARATKAVNKKINQAEIAASKSKAKRQDGADNKISELRRGSRNRDKGVKTSGSEPSQDGLKATKRRKRPANDELEEVSLSDGRIRSIRREA